ncbi:MAG: hypothetical protein AAFQ63_20610 [Cyanobacteria bacterium J06621_11]
MLLQELKEKVAALPIKERLALISWIAESLQSADQKSDWQFLETRSDSWREQLYIKGRKLPASIIWSDMIANEMTVKQAVKNWDLPATAIQEALQYCESHRELISREAKIDRKALPSGERLPIVAKQKISNPSKKVVS